MAFHALHQRPLRILLMWSAAFVVINAGMAFTLASERLGLGLSADDAALYEEAFSLLTRGPSGCWARARWSSTPTASR